MTSPYAITRRQTWRWSMGLIVALAVVAALCVGSVRPAVAQESRLIGRSPLPPGLGIEWDGSESSEQVLGVELLIQVIWQRRRIVKRLIGDGAAIDLQTGVGWTALCFAASSGNRVLVRMLLAAGANPNHQSDGGRSPLHIAASNRRAGAIRLLLRAGADPNVTDNYGATPFLLAAGSLSTNALAVLGELKIDPNHRDGRGRNALHVALTGKAIGGRTTETDVRRTVVMLLDMGVDPSAVVDRWGWSPLLAAVSGGYLSVAKLLARRGASWDVRSTTGETPLLLAVFYQRPNVLRYLLRRGVALDGVDDGGRSPLHYAARGRSVHTATYASSVECVELLLRYGAQVDVADDDGNTPLMLAAERGYPDIVRTLLAAGADPELRNTDGRRALDSAGTHALGIHRRIGVDTVRKLLRSVTPHVK